MGGFADGIADGMMLTRARGAEGQATSANLRANAAENDARRADNRANEVYQKIEQQRQTIQKFRNQEAAHYVFIGAVAEAYAKLDFNTQMQFSAELNERLKMQIADQQAKNPAIDIPAALRERLPRTLVELGLKV